MSVFVSKDLRGKMLHVPAINTNTLTNPFCSLMKKRATKLFKSQGEKLVCLKCYARRWSLLHPNIQNIYEGNSKLLSSYMFEKDIPIIKSDILRFNAFGELINEGHYLNLKRIAIKNPSVIFALWTKRPDLVHGKKVKNIIYIFSSPMINKVATKPKGFDKVFTVFSKDRTDVNINCHNYEGACRKCMLCYSKNDVVYINEYVK